MMWAMSSNLRIKLDKKKKRKKENQLRQKMSRFSVGKRKKNSYSEREGEKRK